MRSKIGAGIVSGLIAGVFFGMMMQMMTAPTPEGKEIPTMRMVAMVVRSQSIVVGWVYHLVGHLVFGLILGAAFVWLTRPTRVAVPGNA